MIEIYNLCIQLQYCIINQQLQNCILNIFFYKNKGKSSSKDRQGVII
jgi:hypothetical protein